MWEFTVPAVVAVISCVVHTPTYYFLEAVFFYYLL
jgi:uncharacterized membrane protein